jgi:hypothetical protein
VIVEPYDLTVRDLAEGYTDNDEEGVVGYGGRLDIRPAYQREFVYEDKQRDAVVDTVVKGYPLNVMYWSVREDGNFEIIDGQQRTISICQYVNGDFSFNGRYFHNLQTDEKESILSYKLTIYRCSGTDTERLEWFRTINIAGEELTDQELLNATFAGPWLSDAKPYFSKSNCPAYRLGGDYMKGSTIRQEYLETVLRWISDGDIVDYMGKHQHDANANAEWLYFQEVIAWVKATFPKYRHEMKGVEWGPLYDAYKGAPQDTVVLEERIARLMADDDVTKKPGIYIYVLTGDERKLSIRSFTDSQKREAYERQEGICPKCKEHFEIGEMEADHITPWSAGGRTIPDNCQMLCKDDNRRKSDV